MQISKVLPGVKASGRSAMYDQFIEGKADWARRRIRQGERLSGRQWAKVIEVAGDDPLPPDVRRWLIEFQRR